MPELIQVDWNSGSSFMHLIQGLIAQASRRWGGEPTEALGQVWMALHEEYTDGTFIDSGDPRLNLIIVRKVINFYCRSDRPPSCQPGRISLDGFQESVLSARKDAHPDDEAARRERIMGVRTAISGLRPKRREAAHALWTSDGTTGSRELASRWGTSRQNVEKHAKKALEDLRAPLARFN